MLKNKIVVKKIRNIFILLMAIIIMLGAYSNIRNSRAENVIQIELEVADKDEALSTQTVTIDATENKEDGTYSFELPEYINGIKVSKYYKADGTEVDMLNTANGSTVADTTSSGSTTTGTTANGSTTDTTATETATDTTLNTETATDTETKATDTSSSRTVVLTADEIANSDSKVQLSTEYDRKAVTTADEKVVVLYNKELQNNENGDVIVSGYMPADAILEVKDIDLATLTAVTLPNEKEKMQSAYEISVYQDVVQENDAQAEADAQNTSGAQTDTQSNGAQTDAQSTSEAQGTSNETQNTTSGETTTQESSTQDGTTDATGTTANNGTGTTNSGAGTTDTETNTSEQTTTNATGTTDTTTVTTERVEYDASAYGENLTIKIKNAQSTLNFGNIYGLADDNSVAETESTEEGGYIQAVVEKAGTTQKYILAIRSKIEEQEDTNTESLVGATSTVNYLIYVGDAEGKTPLPSYHFLGNENLERQYIENITFVNSTSGANSTKWDVSANQDGSILAWYTGTKPYKVYIGSDSTIYANPNSDYLFAHIGYDSCCTATETITNIELLNTSKVTSMQLMFYNTGCRTMTKLDLGSNFDTSNVTNFSGMFVRNW